MFQKSLDMALEQDKEEAIKRLKEAVISNSLSPGVLRRDLLSENILYYISHGDSDPICVYISEAIYNILFLPNTFVCPTWVKITLGMQYAINIIGLFYI